MSAFKIYKETALPGTLEAHAIYLVAPSANPTQVEMYVTGTSPATVRRIHTEADIQAMIDASLASINEVQIVADITARDALTLTQNGIILVVDATGDSTVDAGAATYAYNHATTTFTKISEAESMDVSLDWADIANKPTSTVAAIDAAVAATHTHTNKTELDKVGEDANGCFTYDGDEFIGVGSTNW